MSERITCKAVASAALGPPVKKAGSELLWRCPNHTDEHPSLSVNPSKDVWMCGPCRASGNAWQLAAILAHVSADDKAAVTAWLRKHGLLNGKRQIVAVYEYQDVEGRPVGRVVRTNPKGFYQERPNGKGGWEAGGFPPTLYNLPKVLKAKSVLVLEGEKDCETARRLGLVAMCNPGGAGKWREEYSQFLTGKRIAVIPDNDTPGVAHAHDVCRSLIGKAENLKLVSLAPEKDLSAWLGAGGTREGLLEIVNQAAELRREEVAAWGSASPSPRGFNLTSLGELMREPDEQVSWLLEGVLPAGGLSLLAAKPKVGKSTLARCLALSVARGKEFLGRATVSSPVIYLALEEKRSEVRRHFRELGAEGSERIHIHCAAAPQDAIPALLEAVKEHKPGLVIVDPILRMTRVRDANDYAGVSNALEPLMSLAREHGAHLLLVYHLGKGERAEATDAILGSTAFFAAVDTALVMKRSEQYRTLQSRQRYGEDLPETVLEFDPDRRAVSLGAERSEADARAVAEEILKFLEGAADAKSEPEINQAIEGRNAAKRQALRQLVDEGRVLRSGSGKRGNPYQYSFSFSCPQHIPGTRVQETPKEADTRINTEGNLVPEEPAKPFLVPENEKADFDGKPGMAEFEV